MGQKVNPKLYKLGVSNFWDNSNIPFNPKLVNFINYNYIFNLISCFFSKYNIQVYFFKAKVQKELFLTAYLYRCMYMGRIKKKKKEKKKKVYFY